MDPFTLAVSVAGLASLAMQLGETLGTYLKDVSGAKKSIEETHSRVVTLTQILKSLDSFLRSEEGKGKAFDETSVLVQATFSCRGTVQQIMEKLDREKPTSVVTGRISISQGLRKLAWPFSEKEHKRQLDLLDNYTRLFQFSLTLDGCAVLSKTADKVSDALSNQLKTLQQISNISTSFGSLSAEAASLSKQLSSILAIITPSIGPGGYISQKLSSISQDVQNIHLRQQHQDSEKALEKKKEALDELSTMTFRKRHQNIREQRHLGTGEWFLEMEEFKQWIEDDEKPILWCPGIPGAGKTVMTSLVADYLQEHVVAPSDGTGVGLAYVYCDYTDSNTHNHGNLIASFQRQLAERAPLSATDIVDFLAQTQEDSNKLDVSASNRQFTSLKATTELFHHRVFLLVDALDECVGEDARGNSNRFQLLSQLKKLPHSVRVFITSRPNYEIAVHLRQARRVPISAYRRDVEKYVEARILELPSLVRFVAETPELEHDIVSSVTERFLHARLQMDHLGKQITEGRLRLAMETMPLELFSLYDIAMERILGQDKERLEIARRVLGFLCHYQLPATQQCIQKAIVFGNSKENSLWGSESVSIDTISDACGGLVDIHQGDALVELTHFTVKEYLLPRSDRYELASHKPLAEACLTALGFSQSGIREVLILGSLLGIIGLVSTFWGLSAGVVQLIKICISLRLIFRVGINSSDICSRRLNLEGHYFNCDVCLATGNLVDIVYARDHWYFHCRRSSWTTLRIQLALVYGDLVKLVINGSSKRPEGPGGMVDFGIPEMIVGSLMWVDVKELIFGTTNTSIAADSTRRMVFSSRIFDFPYLLNAYYPAMCAIYFLLDHIDKYTCSVFLINKGQHPLLPFPYTFSFLFFHSLIIISIFVASMFISKFPFVPSPRLMPSFIAEVLLNSLVNLENDFLALWAFYVGFLSSFLISFFLSFFIYLLLCVIYISRQLFRR